MTLIIKTVRQYRRTVTLYSAECPPGSGYCEDQRVYEIERTTWRVGPLPVWSTTRYVREIPPHEWIARAVYG